MKLCAALLTASLCSLSAFAQLNPIPPSSLGDGIVVRAFAASPSQSSWAASSLVDYRLSAGNPFVTPAAGTTDSFGRLWTSAAPSVNGVNTHGGTVREIFLGASGPAVRALGYSYSGSPASNSSYSLASAGSVSDPASLSFGDWADVSLAAHEFDSFDLWLNTALGAYTLFAPEHRVAPASQHADVLWTHAPLMVSTFIPALGANADVETWIVSLVEYSADQQSRTEYRFALQQFERSGNNLALDQNTTPVPEPSTYALVGACVCGLLVLQRSRRRR